MNRVSSRLFTRRDCLALASSGLLCWGAERPLLEYRDRSGGMRPVRNRRDWSVRVTQVKEAMQEVMGPLPPRAAAPPAVAIIEETLLPLFARLKILYTAEEGDRVPAYLLLPKGTSRRRPAMLCLHQTVKIGKDEPVGLGGKPNLRYACELAERGYVTLAPDYPNYGDYRFDAYSRGYVSATMKGIVNHIRGVDLLVSRAEVDASRIGVIGHSLGGHNSMFVAAFEPRIGAVVTSCGFTSFPKYYGGNLTGWSHAGYMPKIASVYQKSPDRMPFDFPEVLASLAPRHVFINAPLRDANFEVSGVRDCVDAARAVYRKIFDAEKRLVAVHPDCAHDFPCEIREKAYAFLDTWSRATPAAAALCGSA